MVLSFFSCKKPENRSCFKSVGDLAVKEISLDFFNKLYLGPHLKYRLIQGNENKVVVRGGENLLNFVSATIEDDRLSIVNKNKCNFLRSYKKEISVDVYFQNIYSIDFEGTKDLIMTDTIHAPYLSLIITDGAGKCDLTVDSDQLIVIVTNGWGNFDIDGKTKFVKLDIRGDGFGDLYGLKVKDSMDVLMQTSNVVKVYPDQVPLRVQSYGIGDVWYKGTPSSIQFNRYGEGDLVNKN